jgi:hypothetical protein
MPMRFWDQNLTTNSAEMDKHPHLPGLGEYLCLHVLQPVSQFQPRHDCTFGPACGQWPKSRCQLLSLERSTSKAMRPFEGTILSSLAGSRVTYRKYALLAEF